MRLRMGTRGSALALAQSGQTAAALMKLHPGLEVETVRIQTSGDRFSIQSPAEVSAMASGTKGLFVKEIEEALAEGRVDFAIHSAKDLPAELMAGLAIAAYPEREDPRDVFIGQGGLSWKDAGAGTRIGTSSLRRQIQLLAAKPGLKMLPMRGNVDTRLRKMNKGDCDALVLAGAGLRRLGLGAVPHEELAEELLLPAPGQGALAVEARQDRRDVVELLAKLDDRHTRVEVELERAFLKVMGGGCSVPLAARAKLRGAEADFSVFYSEMDGSRAVRLNEVCRDLPRAEEFARELAGRVRRR
ncbi:MAG: hydroxymethylbilane synthase [Elusimicrobia bacterium]|nr:hydroxymethylbilane synthase [Elusimicrobiota bacterium]